jgi:hypothetical protein
MNLRNLSIVAAGILSLAACSKNSDKPVGAAAVSAPALEDSKHVMDTYNAGVPNYTFSVDSEKLSIDGITIEHADENSFAG